MKIRRIIPNEPEGKVIPMGDIEYRFVPDANGNNVCEVNEKAHVSRFLSIPEGYEVDDPTLRDKAPAVTVAVVSSNIPDPLAGSSTTDMVDDDTVVPTDEEIEAEVKAAAAEPNEFNGLTRKQLAALYQKKFGKRPGSNWKDSTIAEKLVG